MKIEPHKLIVPVTLNKAHGPKVFGNRELRRIFGPKREEVAGSWRRLRNEERHAVYAPPNVITVIKSLRMRLAGHVALMGEVGNACNILVREPEGMCHLEDQVIDMLSSEIAPVPYEDVLGILDLGTRWSEWPASRHGRFTLMERVPSTHSIGD
jgi:hypothetical protein